MTRPSWLPYRATHHQGGYHSEEEFNEMLFGRGDGDIDHYVNPDQPEEPDEPVPEPLDGMIIIAPDGQKEKQA